jgi:hypothetical protein
MIIAIFFSSDAGRDSNPLSYDSQLPDTNILCSPGQIPHRQDRKPLNLPSPVTLMNSQAEHDVHRPCNVYSSPTVILQASSSSTTQYPSMPTWESDSPMIESLLHFSRLHDIARAHTILCSQASTAGIKLPGQPGSSYEGKEKYPYSQTSTSMTHHSSPIHPLNPTYFPQPMSPTSRPHIPTNTASLRPISRILLPGSKLASQKT